MTIEFWTPRLLKPQSARKPKPTPAPKKPRERRPKLPIRAGQAHQKLSQAIICGDHEPAAVATLAHQDITYMRDTRDEFGEAVQVLDVPDDLVWPPSEAENDVLLLSNADFVRRQTPRPLLWVLWSAVLIEGNAGYDYHCTAVPLSVFEQSLANDLQLCSDP